MQSSSSDIINLIEWENLCVLSNEEITLIKDIDLSKKILINNSESKKLNFDNLEYDSILFSQSNITNLEISNLIPEIEKITIQNTLILEKLNKIIECLDSYKTNVNSLNSLKESLLKKINDLYKNSSEIIDQQKELLEINNLIKSHLLYYTQYDHIEKEIDQISLNVNNKEIFEGKIIHKIIDLLIFLIKEIYKDI